MDPDHDQINVKIPILFIVHALNSGSESREYGSGYNYIFSGFFICKKCLLLFVSGDYKEMSSIVADQPIAPSCMSLNAEGEGVAGSQAMSTVQLYTGAQINFGDLTPYLTYGLYPRSHTICVQLPLREGIVSYLKFFKFVFVPTIHSKSHLPYMNTFDLQATRVLCLQFFLTKLLFSLQMHTVRTS